MLHEEWMFLAVEARLKMQVLFCGGYIYSVLAACRFRREVPAA